MSKTRIQGAVAALLLSVCLSSGAQDVEVRAEKLSGNIYMITGQGGNIGLLTGEDGSFLVDDQFAPLTGKIIDVVKSVGGDVPRFLINTHFHGDHTGGNENLGKQGTLIMSHQGVRERLASGSSIAAFSMTTGPAPKAALPVVTYTETLRLHINGETVRIEHAPYAHTDGDSFVVFENADVIHAGDLFFNGFFPFVDAANGGTLRGVIAAADRMLAIAGDNTRIIPGHGPLASRGDLKRYRTMLAIANERLRKLKNQGVSAEDAVVMGPLDDIEAAWGGGIFDVDKWIQIVYPAVY